MACSRRGPGGGGLAHVGHRGRASELSHGTLPDSPWHMSACPYHASSVPRLPHPSNGQENAVSWT